jgi:iron complex outermembrane receptor protein
VTRIYTLLIAALTAFNSGYAQTPLLVEVPVNNAGEFAEEKETGTVRGQVQTNDNQPAAYVTVTLKEANRSTLTDENGGYILRKIKPGQYTLLVTMAGLQSKEQAITVKSHEVLEVHFALA